MSRYNPKFIEASSNNDYIIKTSGDTTVWDQEIYTSGLTYTPNTLSIGRTNGKADLTASINEMSGLTVNGESIFSGSAQNVVTIIGSGDTTPLFSVKGSKGELFAVTDSLTGSLFAVSDISGLPILEVFSDRRILLGEFQAPALFTTSKVIATSGGTTTVYSIPISAYTGAFFDYTVSDGTNLRAGTVSSVFSSTNSTYNETSTTDLGNTSDITFNVSVVSGIANLVASATTANWIIKTIVRSV